MKTAAYEIAEQMEWEVPDWGVLPVGGGSLLVGLYEGFRQLLEHGITKRIPRLVAVQSANCAPIFETWSRGMDNISTVEKRVTAAEGIAVAHPVRGRLILETLRASRGMALVVSDDAIWHAHNALARAGTYVEPTSAAAIAGIDSLCSRGDVAINDRIVAILTGSGLKATDKIVEHYRF